MTEAKANPPRAAVALLRYFADPEDSLSLLGDVEEEFKDAYSQKGTLRAHLWIWLQVLISLCSFLKPLIYRSLSMFTNYLKVTFRNLRRHKAFAFINIAGLSVGILCALLIILVVRYEFQYERHHENADRIYRINIEHVRLEGSYTSTYTPVPLAPVLRDELPHVVGFARMAVVRQVAVAHEELRHNEEGVRFADPGILEMFSFPLVKGDRASALKDIDSIVLTEDMAEKYFGRADPLGETLVLLNSMPLKVTGVMKNHPEYTNIHPDFLVPFERIRDLTGDDFFNNWVSQQIISYVMLGKGHTRADVEPKIQAAFERRVPSDDGRVLSLDRLSRMHLFSATAPAGNINSLFNLMTVGALLLLIACINFMNLATARSAQRAVEVGLRKVVGAARGQLIRQFIGESLIHTSLSMAVACVLVNVLIPVLNGLTGQAVHFADLFHTGILIGITGIFCLVGFVSGSYPAFFLSAVPPTKILRKTYESGTRGVLFRKILVVSQFVVSIALIASTLIFGKQLDFLLNKPLGFEKDRILAIRNDRENLGRDLLPFKKELLRDPDILAVAGSQMLPSSIGIYNTVTWEGATGGQEISINYNSVDYDFLDTYEIDLISGRNFSPQFAQDAVSDSDQNRPESPRSIIINQEAARQFGWNNPIGKQVFEVYGTERLPLTVVGVIKDFHFNSLRYSIRPLKLFLSTGTNRYISVKIQMRDPAGTLDTIKKAWAHYFPDTPFDYFFLDSSFDQRYRSEASMKRLLEYGSGLAVFIGCLGLLGLASHAAARRAREIAIRKVLGASSAHIVRFMSREFLFCVALSNLFAWPIAYFAMKSWLDHFAYRIDLNAQWGLFILAGAIALAVALLAVVQQALKAAHSDPIKTITYE